MNIPPILERLLLSNEAVFKNASLGLSGENMVYVPPGKTAVLLEFSIEPFVNDISTEAKKLFGTGFNTDVDYSTIFSLLRERLCYQMQIINDNYATYFSFHDSFSIVNNITGPDTDSPSVSLNFAGKREELFIYTDRSMYFNFLYPYSKIDANPAIPYFAINYSTNPSVGFSPTIQNLPKQPITFNQATTGDFVTWVYNGTFENYFPVGQQFGPTISSPGAASEYLHFYYGNSLQSYAYNSIAQPQSSDDSLTFADLFTIPLVNVKYALINRRPSDYGIVKP
jgi:hypothetical protein